MRRRKFGRKIAFIVIWQRSQNQFRYPKKLPTLRNSKIYSCSDTRNCVTSRVLLLWGCSSFYACCLTYATEIDTHFDAARISLSFSSKCQKTNYSVCVNSRLLSGTHDSRPMLYLKLVLSK